MRIRCLLAFFITISLLAGVGYAVDCWDYDNQPINCTNYTLHGLNCTYNEEFGWCDPNWAEMSCSDFCGMCSQSECGTVNPICMWLPELGICVEDPDKYVHGGDCDVDCLYCLDVDSCEGSAAGCQWFGSGDSGWCDWTGAPVCEEDCFVCTEESQCAASPAGCIWDATNYLCKPDDWFGEICFDGINNDGDELIDCDDPDCAWDPFCGGEEVSPCVLITDLTMCDAHPECYVEWIEEGVIGFCEPLGKRCREFQTVVDCDPGFCDWQDGPHEQFCDLNITCGGLNLSQCLGPTCEWVGYCRPLPARCFDHLTQEECVADGLCFWNSFIQACEPLCFNQTTSSDCNTIPGCVWRPGVCKPEMLMTECYMFDEEQCETELDCSWIPVAEHCDLNHTTAEVCYDIIDPGTCDGNPSCKWMGDYCEFKPNLCFGLNQSDCLANPVCNWMIWPDGFEECVPACFGFDNQTACDGFDSLCQWRAGLCEPAFGEDIFAGFDPGPPIILGIDPEFDHPDAPGNAWLDIIGVGIKDMPGSFGIGIMVRDITAAAQCNFMYNGVQPAKYYFYLDTDGNASTGCKSFDYNITNFTGFEYKFAYIANFSANKVEERKIGYACINGSWVKRPIEMSPKRDIGCAHGAAVIGIEKADIGNPRGDMRVYVATGNCTLNQTHPKDRLDKPVWYTPGAVDFEPPNCFENPFLPGCGGFGLIGGGFFMPFEDCLTPFDDDLDGKVNCEDEDCFMAPVCAPLEPYNCSADISYPTITTATVEAFHDMAFIMWDTDEPANGTVLFYGNYSNCTVSPIANVSQFDSPYFALDDYRLWHDVVLVSDPYDPFPDVVLYPNETYHYKIMSCDRACPARCSISKCLSFTTAETPKAFKFDFDFDALGDPLLEGMLVKLLYPNGTIIEIDLTELPELNYSTGVVISFDPVIWAIDLYGVDLVRSRDINLTGKFKITSSPDEPYGPLLVGMDHQAWLDLAQNLGVDTIQITLPYPAAKLLSCNETGGNCTDVTQYVRRISSSASESKWLIPAALGFSGYQGCYESWSCTDWGSCIAGIQTRTCTDANACGTVEYKPSESRSCAFFAPAPVPAVYDLDEDFAISNISEQTMQEGDSATLTWAGVLHTITLAEVGADFVRLLIESPLINITINVTETTEVDLDGDGIADLAITLDKIEDGRASLTFTKLVPAPPPVIKCPEPAPEPGPWGPCINGTQERRVYECIEGNWVEKTESKSCVVLPPPLVPPALPLWPAAVVVILLLVAGYWFFIKPKKKPKK